MNEFKFIATHLAPLAHNQAALNLRDDAAVLQVPSGYELVITKDALVEGVHFTGRESPELIARKMLRVNLSDLAAMGATPYGYFMALMLPAKVDEIWLAAFAAGLRMDQETYKIDLLGGDTTRTPGPLGVSVTMLGLVPQGKALTRSGAKIGDDIYVSGTIGDAALGLRIAKKRNESGERGKDRSLLLAPRSYLLQRYQLPEPRVILGEMLRDMATSCMDISDGLAQDMGHICAASDAGAVVHYPLIPLSNEAKTLLASEKNPHALVLAGGDDYELLFTAPASMRARIAALGHNVTRIGQITQEPGLRILDADEKPIMLTRKGFQHFE